MGTSLPQSGGRVKPASAAAAIFLVARQRRKLPQVLRTPPSNPTIIVGEGGFDKRRLYTDFYSGREFERDYILGRVKLLSPVLQHTLWGKEVD